MNVLAFGAHPNDVELTCAGTLAKCVRAGHRVTIVVLCSGDSGGWDRPPEEAIPTRESEARTAAEVIGADIHLLAYPDHHVPTDDAVKHRITEIMRLARPTYVITHDPEDTYTDHRRAGELVLECADLACHKRFATESSPIETVPPVLFMDTVGGVGFVPDTYVDITELFEMKRRMLQCHISQITPWVEHPWLETFEWVEVTARFRGIQCGVRYAEAFRHPPRWLGIPPFRLLP